MQLFDSVREKDFKIHFCTRNQNYIQSIESDCRNKGESLSFAHSYSVAWLDLSCKRTQFWNFGPIEEEIHIEHSDIRRRLS